MSKISAASRPRDVVSFALAFLFSCATGLGQNISQFDVYWATDGIALGPDGAMWFTDLQFDRIGRIDTNGVVTAFSLPGVRRFPEGIALGLDGNLWFTEIGPPGGIGRITTLGVVTEFQLPGLNPRPCGITSGPDGNLWFTEQGTNAIGRITTEGVLTEFLVPTARAGLAGIRAGPDGNLWFAEADANKIGRITTDGAITEFALPTANSRPGAIASGPDGKVWFTESYAPRVGRISPTGDIAEFPVSGGSIGVAAGNDGHMWFTGYRVLRRVAPSGVVTEFPAPLYGPSDLGIAMAPDGALWMTDNVNGFGAQIVRFEYQILSPPQPPSRQPSTRTVGFRRPLPPPPSACPIEEGGLATCDPNGTLYEGKGVNNTSTFIGKVVGPDGVPIANAIVSTESAYSWSAAAWCHAETTTDAQGNFTLNAIGVRPVDWGFYVFELKVSAPVGTKTLLPEGWACPSNLGTIVLP